MFEEPSMGRPCTLLRLLEVGPTPAPPMRDSGCVMVFMRLAAAILGSVYSCRNAFSLLGMILSRPYCKLGLVKPQLPSLMAARYVNATCVQWHYESFYLISFIYRITKRTGQCCNQQTWGSAASRAAMCRHDASSRPFQTGPNQAGLRRR